MNGRNAVRSNSHDLLGELWLNPYPDINKGYWHISAPRLISGRIEKRLRDLLIIKPIL